MPTIDGIWVSPSSLAMKAKKAVRPKVEVPKVLDARENFTFGCDPELFVFNVETNQPVPAGDVGIVGSKDKPSPCYDSKGDIIGWSQVDGMAAEFNIPPVTTFKDFNRHIEGTLKALSNMLVAGHELRAVPAVTFAEDVFNAAPDSAKELGCSPDYNAWTGKINPPPKDENNPFLRTASGHLHIGWTKGADITDTQHIMNCRDVVKQFDYYLGAWSLSLDPDPIRRRLYGEAGAMRFKEYGTEYRVLSNFWVMSRERRLAVWNRMQKAIEDIARAYLPDREPSYDKLLIDSIKKGTLNPMLANIFTYPMTSLA